MWCNVKLQIPKWFPGIFPVFPIFPSTNTDLILKGLTWNFCLVYIDDIIVYSPSFEQHIDDLDRVLSAL